MFALTGSVWATTNNVEITGSLAITSQLGITDANLIATDSASLYLTSGSNLYVNNGLVELTNSSLVIHTGDLTVNNGLISGAFKGDGAQLYNIPATGVTGLQLDRIVSGSVSASLQGGKLNINTDVNVDGILTAKQLDITYVSSSVLYESGSTKFGDTLDDTHQFTGSILATGSLEIYGDLKVHGTTYMNSTDANKDTLIVSGALNLVQNQINAQLYSASLKLQSMLVLINSGSNGIMDLGEF